MPTPAQAPARPPAQTTLLAVFDLRCRTRREVAEALSLIPAESRYAAAAQTLSQQYLDALGSALALREVSASSRALAAQVRSELCETA